MGEPSLDLLTVQQPNLSDRVIRALDIKGDVPGLLQPRYDLSIQADDFTLPEYKYLSRTMMMAATAAQAAGAALFSYVGLTFLAASSASSDLRICRVKRVTFTNPNAGAIFVSGALSTGDLTVFATGSTPTPLDSRWLKNGVQARGSMRTVVANIATPPPVQVLFGVAAGGNVTYELDAVLSNFPTGFTGQTGGVLLFAPSAVNQSLQVTFEWEEREAMSSEA